MKKEGDPRVGRLDIKNMRRSLWPLTLLFFFSLGSTSLFSQEEGAGGSDIKAYLESSLPPQEGRIITLNEATGLLTITDTPTHHRFIKELLKRLDVGSKQISIEAKFVEVSIADINELGIEWYWYKHGERSDKWSDVDIGTGDTEDSGIHWDGGGLTFPKTSEGLDLFISSTTYSGDFIRSYLHALEQAGKANLLSAPKVTTLSGQMANIQIVSTFPYTSSVDLENIGTADHPTWEYSYTFNEESVGITLEVTPTVGEDSKVITLEIRPKVDVLSGRVSIHSLVPSRMGWPMIDSRSTDTTVYVKSGETIILGGLMSDDTKLYKRKVPILGNIPLLGRFFKYEYETKKKKNLLIFITATLVTSTGEEVL